MSEWIPIKTRPMDEEERIEWSERLGYDIEGEEAVIYVSQLPDDGEEVLTCDRYGTIRIDTFSNDPDFFTVCGLVIGILWVDAAVCALQVIIYDELEEDDNDWWLCPLITNAFGFAISLAFHILNHMR